MMNASDIRSRLRSYYPSLEWALLFEVGNATGGRKTRSADAIAMNLWPSRGLSIHGIEIKVSRSDFKAEMKNPLKAEEIAQYCDYWWIAAPADMLQPDELPEAWGLLVSSNDSMKIRKQAIKNEGVKQPDRAFVAGLARRALESIERYEHSVDRDSSHSEFGSIDAYVSESRTYNGKPAVYVRDRVSRKVIPCILSDSLATAVGQTHSWRDTWEGKRVRIRGQIFYDKNGSLSRISATHLTDISARRVDLKKLRESDLLSPTDHLNQMWESGEQ